MTFISSLVLSNEPSRQLPEDEPERVDVGALPRFELGRVDGLVQDFRRQVALRPNLAVVRDVDLVGRSGAMD